MGRPSKLVPNPEALVESPADDVYLSGPDVRKRYGNVSQMTLARWQQNPRVNFPKASKIGHYNFWKLSDLLAFERTLPVRTVKADREAA